MFNFQRLGDPTETSSGVAYFIADFFYFYNTLYFCFIFALLLTRLTVINPVT